MAYKVAYKEIDESNIILINSVSSFIEMIKQVKETKEVQDGTSTELYFRGQETEFWDIEPSIFRDDMLSMPEYSKKKLTKACEILKMISEKPNISIDELRIALDVTDRTIARYISELKDKGIIERKGPDNGGKWKIK